MLEKECVEVYLTFLSENFVMICSENRENHMVRSIKSKMMQHFSNF